MDRLVLLLGQDGGRRAGRRRLPQEMGGAIVWSVLLSKRIEIHIETKAGGMRMMMATLEGETLGEKAPWWRRRLFRRWQIG